MHMTRENKLALVVGFGLILLVGVLISDHFSTARNQESADLAQARPVDPLSQTRRTDPGLIDLGVNRSREESNALRAPLATNTAQIANGRNASQSEPKPEPQPQNNAVQQIVMGEPVNGERDNEQSQQRGEVPFIFHDVRAGETLTSIAQQYYDSTSRDLVNDLARFNGLDDANSLRINHRLRIPASGDLRRGTPAPARTQPSSLTRDTAPAPQQQVYTTYTVQRGDTLSELSLKLLGTSRRWRELYEFNRDVIADPDNLRAGTELKVPRPG